MKHTFARLSVGTLCLFIAACSGSDSTGPKTPAHVGSYGLASVNSAGLPGVIFQNSVGRLSITGGTLILRADNSYTETLNFSTFYFATGASVPDVANENGTYTVIGSQITFTIPASGTAAAFSYTGAVSGDNLSYTYDGTSYQYRKNP